ncbi:MAG: histidine phosphatase family protein [Spirochaetaceae bacterium]
MVNLYLIRHGECEGNGTYIGRGSDVLLTDFGTEQIKKIDNIKNVDYFYTSPMKRSVLTSDILSKQIGLKATPVIGLEEIDFGDWEGLSFSDINNQSSEKYTKWINDPINNRPPNGETLIDLKTRVLSSFPDINRLVADNKSYNIIIVSHKGPLSILLLDLLALDLKHFWTFKLNRGSVSKINLYKDFSEVEFLNKI